MATSEQLREYCKVLIFLREKEVAKILSDYFEFHFIEGHHPWRAVIGNRRCKPIPIHRNILPFHKKDTVCTSIPGRYFWPNLSDDLIRKALENLGFVVTEHNISVTVPPCEKGKELTFAQEWVNKINKSYTVYRNQVYRHNIKELYSDFLQQLCDAPQDKVNSYDGYTLFVDFQPTTPALRVNQARALIAMAKRDGITFLHDEKKYYKGVMVSHRPPVAPTN